MPMYKPTIWVDDVPGVQTGTDLNAANFNNMETGVFESYALAALNSTYQRYANDAAAQTAIMSFTATLTPGTQTIALPESATRNTTDYSVGATVKSAEGGAAGNIIVNTQQANGFKAKYEGDATSVTVVFGISGGMI